MIDQQGSCHAVEPIHERVGAPVLGQGLEHLHLPALPGVLFAQDLRTWRPSEPLVIEQR